MAEREQAKADELAQLGWPQVSRATVRRMRARDHAGGLKELVPQREPSRATGRADERWDAAVLEALRRQRGHSRAPRPTARRATTASLSWASTITTRWYDHQHHLHQRCLTHLDRLTNANPHIPQARPPQP